MSGTLLATSSISALSLPATLENSLLFRTESQQPDSQLAKQAPTPRTSNCGSPRTPKTNVHGTPNKSPRRINTDPDLFGTADDQRLRVHKRIIVCCDGTWQDGIGDDRSMYTNVLRLARTIHHEDERFQPPIPQIVFYQSGIGTEKNFYSEYIEGTTGGSLADKVEEAYAFIAHNYNPGDEIFLFGFSRGAYTVRMVAMFVGEIGILSRKEMDNFAKIFLTYQKLGKSKKPEDKDRLKEELKPWRKAGSAGKMRADIDGDTFTVKCVGVFDTVGSLGIPESLSIRSPRAANLFGFPDRQLGEHIERAYQALALHEMRADFNCNKFEQSEQGIAKGQILKQCWFTGAHSDIGGGYKEHDLADIALTWMAANVGDILAFDTEYLANLPQPVAPWGQQKPHDSRSGIFFLSHSLKRGLPDRVGLPCHEQIHPSVLEQAKLFPALDALLSSCPQVKSSLLPLEEEMKVNWPYKPDSPVARTYTTNLQEQLRTQPAPTATDMVLSKSTAIGRKLLRTFSLTRRTPRPPEDGAADEKRVDLVMVEESNTELQHIRSPESDTRRLRKTRRRTVYATTHI